MKNKFLFLVSPSSVTFMLILLCWEASCRIWQVPDFILPSPSRIFEAIVEVGFDKWSLHLSSTLKVALLGFLSAICIAIPLSIIMTESKLIRRSLYPILIVIQTMPIVAIAPLLIITLGTEDLPKIVITFLITFFPIVVSTTTGLNKTPQEYIELSSSLTRSKFRLYSQIRLPFAIPYIFSGLRVAITLAVVGAVVAEFVAAEHGLGYYIQFSTSFYKIPEAFAGLTLLVIVSLILFRVLSLVQGLLFKWSLNSDSVV